MTTEEFHRKLTAILSADVQGYSRLMEEDEESTIRTLTAYRALMTSLIQKHRGHVVDTPGDNLLAEFGSVLDAVRCAVEIQEELRIKNADLPEDRKMQFRIGINLGDVVEDRDHIYGDGINIAARVEGLADGGGICISGTVYDAIRNKLSMSYEFMGEHVIKNIKELVRIYRIRVEPEAETPVKKDKKAGLRKWHWAVLSVVGILVLGSVAYILFDKFYFDRSTSEISQVPAASEDVKIQKKIAVLPFVDISPEKDQEYFVDGLSEELLNTLAQIPDLGVTARTSSFTFKNSDKKVQEIASELGVDNILEGSVRKAGNALRISAQLIRASDGLHLWSKTYDRELKDIFAIQEDIATSVADELKVTLGIGHSFQQLGGTDNARAYEIYLAVQGLWNGRSREGDVPKAVEHAIELIDMALEIDPDFALAWASKATIHTFYIVVGPASQVAAAREEALHAASRAIELEPNLSAGYYALGYIKTTIGDFAEAELAYRKALELSNEMLWFNVPGIALQSISAGYFEKAHTLLEKILEKDPLNHEVRGFYYLSSAFLSDPEKAEEEYKRGKVLLGDEWVWGHWFRNFLHLDSSFPLSRDEMLGSFLVYNEPVDYIHSPEKGLAELRLLLKNDPNLSVKGLGEFGWWASYFGDPEFAMNLMEKGLSVDHGSYFFMWFPIMKEVRQLPRFKEFVREIGLVDYWNEFGWPDICHKLDNDDFECD